MKFFFLTFLLFQIIVVKAQLAIIDDPDGFVNVREGKGSNTKIVGKLTNDQSFLYDGENINDQWVMVFFNDENEVNFNLSGNNKAVHLQGFIHRSRLKPITSLPHSGLTKVNRLLTTNHLIIKNDSIFLSVTTRPFNYDLVWVVRHGKLLYRYIDSIG